MWWWWAHISISGPRCSKTKRKWGDREGGSRRWPGYVMPTKVFFRRAEVFVLGEVYLPRRPHAVLLRSQVLSEKRKWWRTWKADEYIFSFKHRTEVGLHADVSEDFRSSKNNFRGHDISQGLYREPPSLSPSFSLGKTQADKCVASRWSWQLTKLGAQNVFKDILAPALTEVLNQSFEESKVPRVWKLADVPHLPKGKYIEDFNKDLRPISLTTTLSIHVVFYPCCVLSMFYPSYVWYVNYCRSGSKEKIKCRRVISENTPKTRTILTIFEGFVIEKDLKPVLLKFIDPNQYGFIPNSCITFALISMLHHWLEAMDGSGSHVRVAALLDYKKAFDPVDHNLLIGKLHSIGVKPTVVNWICDFLQNRSQRVKTWFQLLLGICQCSGRHSTGHKNRSMAFSCHDKWP